MASCALCARSIAVMDIRGAVLALHLVEITRQRSKRLFLCISSRVEWSIDGEWSCGWRVERDRGEQAKLMGSHAPEKVRSVAYKTYIDSRHL